ncbi:MAG: type II toxin-antitoxin system RelB/DinJ family antitoxin [Syntrophomonas sp.]
MKQKGSRDPQAIFDCVSGWGSYLQVSLRPSVFFTGAALSCDRLLRTISYDSIKRTRTEVDFMPKSSNLYVRIEPDVKEQAEKVFDSLGISMSNAVGLFLKQVVINQAIPFELRLAPAKIKSVAIMTEVELMQN